jgi:hypothetical protein
VARRRFVLSSTCVAVSDATQRWQWKGMRGAGTATLDPSAGNLGRPLLVSALGVDSTAPGYSRCGASVRRCRYCARSAPRTPAARCCCLSVAVPQSRCALCARCVTLLARHPLLSASLARDRPTADAWHAASQEQRGDDAHGRLRPSRAPCGQEGDTRVSATESSAPCAYHRRGAQAGAAGAAAE